MVTQVIFDTLTPMVQGISGTAPRIYSATTDQTLAVITTAGAVADLYASGILKVRDIIFVNYDVDGTPGQAVLTVTATSSGSLIGYTIPAGYLQAANNLSDVANATTAKTNLGIKAGQLSNGGGATTVTLTDAAIVATSAIVATVAASTNASYVVKVVPGTGSAVITLSADPGASTKIAYVILN